MDTDTTLRLAIVGAHALAAVISAVVARRARIGWLSGVLGLGAAVIVWAALAFVSEPATNEGSGAGWYTAIAMMSIGIVPLFTLFCAGVAGWSLRGTFNRFRARPPTPPPEGGPFRRP